jgi:alpha-galactosidase
MEAIVTDNPYKIGGNVLNKGLITNLPAEACVEVPCLVNRAGIQPTVVGALPTQLAAMNMSNIGVQLMTIEAAVTKKREAIYQAAMLDPHTAAELSIDDIVAMCDDLIEAHGDYLPEYH